MKVLFMARSPDAAGAGGDLLRLLPRLDRDAFRSVVVFPEEPGPGALRFQHEGAMVHSLGLDGDAAGSSFGLVASALGVNRLRKVLKELEADVAHGLDASSSAVVAVAGRAAGVPVLIGTWRDHETDPPSWARARALRQLDRLVAPTEETRSEASRLLGGRLPPVTVIRNGIDPAEVRGFARAPEFSEPKLRVGSFALLGAGCGVEEIIEAATLVRSAQPGLEWLVAGSGPRGMAYLRAVQAAGLDKTVRLLGEREDAGPFLASLDAYVSPAAKDAVPSGLLQALSAGVPCIAAKNPSLSAMLVAERDALLVPPKDPRALADAILRLLADEASDLRAALRAGAGRRAALPSADDTAAAMAALYRASAEEARRRAH